MSSTPRPTKTDVVSDFRRTQILDAARQSFIRYGVADTTVDGIAQDRGRRQGHRLPLLQVEGRDPASNS